MSDPTENYRRDMVAEINTKPTPAPEFEGETWTTDQLSETYEVLGFMAPFCVVKRRIDGVKGSLMFQHNPRVYYGFVAD